MTSVAPEPLVSENRRQVLLLAVAVALLAALPFLPALSNGFVSWDDDRNFLRNPFYRGLGFAELKWMWSTYHMGHYIPLSWMTLGLDYLLWGMDARGYHLTNIVLHAANSVVIFFVARRVLSLALNEPRDGVAVGLAAAISSLFFAVHPLRVESVAWATERRDMLSGLFYSLAILMYLRGIEKGPFTTRSYAPVFALFLCALLSKATAMTLPAVLLLLNVFPLCRLTYSSWRASIRDVTRELLPLFMLSAAAAMMSIVALGFRPQLGVIEKLALSSYSVAFYLWKTIVPLSLGPIYPMPLTVPLTSTAYLVSYVVAAALAFVVVTEHTRRTGIAVSIAAFIVITLPMLGVVQNGPQLAADRYTYHSAPALALLVGAVFHAAWKRRAGLTAAVAGVGLTALGSLTWVQTMYWRDSFTLWTRAVEVADHSAIAHDGLGTAYLNRDSLSRALAHYERATQLNPFYADARSNIGIVLARLGRFDEAPQHFQRALELKPDFDAAENNWGVVLAMQGKLMAAIGHYRLALSINPNNADAEFNWANALVAGGNLDVALPHYRRAAELNPAWPDIEARWGAALAQLGRLDEALPHFERAVKLDPNDEKAARLLERARAEIAARQPRVIRQ